MTHADWLHSTISLWRSLDPPEGAGHIGAIKVGYKVSKLFKGMLLDPSHASKDILNREEGKSVEDATPVLDG